MLLDGCFGESHMAKTCVWPYTPLLCVSERKQDFQKSHVICISFSLLQWITKSIHPIFLHFTPRCRLHPHMSDFIKSYDTVYQKPSTCEAYIAWWSPDNTNIHEHVMSLHSFVQRLLFLPHNIELLFLPNRLHQLRVVRMKCSPESVHIVFPFQTTQVMFTGKQPLRAAVIKIFEWKFSFHIYIYIFTCH